MKHLSRHLLAFLCAAVVAACGAVPEQKATTPSAMTTEVSSAAKSEQTVTPVTVVAAATPPAATPEMPTTSEPSPAPATASPAGSEGSANAAPQLDAKAVDVVKKMCAFFDQMQSLRFDWKGHALMNIPQKKKETTLQFEIAAERPNKYAQIAGSSAQVANVISNSTTTTLYFPLTRGYSEVPAPADFTGVFEDTGRGAILNDSFMPILLAKDSYNTLLADASSLRYVGEEELRGTKCDVVKVELDGVKYDMWIRSGEQPVPMRAKPDLSTELEQMGPNSDGSPARYEVTIDFENWSVNQPLPADKFTFTPPADTTKYDSPMQASRPHPMGLIGKSIPPTTLTLLDGKKVDLAQHKGKEAVVLDFWATWCQPCRSIMPVMEKIAGEYKDKGIAFYAVNQGDSPEAIKAFLTEVGVSPAVAVDQEMALGMAYQALSFPTMIMIAKDGTVATIRQGVAREGAEKELRDLFAGLAAGKPLPPPPPETDGMDGPPPLPPMPQGS